MSETNSGTNYRRIEGLPVHLVEVIYESPDVQVLHTILDPGQEIPWHYHSKVDDIFYVVKGPVSIYRKDDHNKKELNSGQLYRMEPRQPHRVCNECEQTVEFLLLQGIGEYDFEMVEDVYGNN